jgi:Cytochrome c7 and related cytochrome c
MRTSSLLGNATLVLALGLSGLAPACGGASGTTPGAQAPSATPSATPSGTAVATGSPGAPASSGAVSTPTTAPAAGPQQPLMATAMAADLKALGFDPGNLPALNKMAPDKLRQVMKTFSKALGTKCTGCHDGNDFRAATRNKTLATKMWDQYVRGLAFEDGAPVYCDSCHQGKMEFLDRHDKKALGKWMETNFVAKLKRTDKRESGCESCHGEDLDMHFLAKWAK